MKHCQIRFVVALAIAALASGFTALPLEQIANTSRTDARAADGTGGWLDLGSNDLSILPDGGVRYSGVAFAVPPSGGETAKNCLVLGRKGAESRTLKLTTPVAEPRLYLLHAVAGAPTPESQTEIGAIVLRYADGSSVRRALATGRDVSEWTSGRSFANAVRGWTEYNRNTQVSLFVSQFKLDAKKPLAEIAFEANGTCAWMVVAASAGEKTKLVPVRSSVDPTGTYKSPEPPANLGRFPGKKPKNIILIIGDGMGQGAARLASYYKHGREDAAYFQQFPVAGLCTTFSASAPVTDSAAAATALATGVKTTNGTIGLQVDKQHDRDHAVPLTSVAARARARGMGVALITSDPFYGATPGGFYAHVLGRGESARICEQAVSCGYDAILGDASSESWLLPEEKGGKRTDGRDLVAEAAATGAVFVRTPAEIAAAPKGSRILGALATLGGETGIAEAMVPVIARLADRPEGFFMMAECADTDHACHANDSSFAVKSVSMVEFMAKAAVDFAQPRGDTLVVITADHDTGHASVLKAGGPNGRLLVSWQDASHTQFPVPVYAYGPGAELFEGLIDNTDVAKNIARLLDLPVLGACLLPAPREYAAAGGSVVKPVVAETRDRSLPPEGYRLSVTPSGATIAAADDRGAFYARETLKQLTEVDGRVACCKVADWPEYPYRAIMIDEGRHFFGKAFMMKTLELMARYKFNTLHWHLTEDQGWRIAIDRYPELTKIGATRLETAVRGRYTGKYDGRQYGPYFYTKDEIRAIVRRATELKIDIIPEIEMPGHCRSVIAAYPELACPTAKLGRRTCWTDWGICDDVVCVSNPKTLEFYKNVIDEVCELFPDRRLHTGGDEVTGVQWKACPVCRAKMKELGFTDVMQLQGWFTQQIYEYVTAKKGRTFGGWSAIFENGTRYDPAKVYAPGGCEDNHIWCAMAGYKTIASPVEYMYWDFNQGLADADKVIYGTWWSGSITLSDVYGFDPRRGVPPAAQKNVIGGEAHNWSEYTYTVPEYEWKIWPRAIALAQALWNPQSGYSYQEEFLPAVKRHIARLRAEGVNCADAFEGYGCATTGGASAANQELKRDETSVK